VQSQSLPARRSAMTAKVAPIAFQAIALSLFSVERAASEHRDQAGHADDSVLTLSPANPSALTPVLRRIALQDDL
jgi:hypothetical protein